MIYTGGGGGEESFRWKPHCKYAMIYTGGGGEESFRWKPHCNSTVSPKTGSENYMMSSL